MLMARRSKRNLAMAWVDYKKAYDMVPHSWILKVSELLGVADNVNGLMERSMASWKTELSVKEEVLGSVNIKRSIFQREFLLPPVVRNDYDSSDYDS